MPRASDADKKLLTQLRERYKRAVDADAENRRLAMDDLKFTHVPGEQWDAKLRADRGSRPCLEFNRLRTTVKRVVNSIRAQRPAGKVRPTEDADKPTAEAYEGLIRNIWANSDGDSVIDAATEYVVAAGMGAWRVVTKYSRDDAWDQDISIEPIVNPFCLYMDPSAKDPLGADAEYWFLTSRMSRSAYQSRWPKAAVMSFEDEGGEFDDEDWSDEESVRVVEYWYREPYSETLLLLSDGRSVAQSSLDADHIGQLSAQGVSIVRSRTVQLHRIKMVIASGESILERSDWAGSYFPFVTVYGETLVIDGKPLWWGLARHAKDAQRAYNYNRTAQVETVARTPTAKYWATPAQADGHEARWAEAHQKNFPVQLYNVDPMAPGPPAHMPGADVPAALIALGQIDGDDIKATTGIYDASLGNRSNETSGIAIRQRQAEGEIAVYNYGDNVAKAVRRTWTLLVDLIPHIYDTARHIRVLGVDGTEKHLVINDGAIDLSRGKYDVTVTTGPSFATQRQEAAEVYMGLMQGNPALFPIVGDLVVKTFDYPYSDEMAERIRLMAPPQIQQMLAQKEQQGGKPLDPRAQAAVAQAEGMMQQVQMQGQLVQQAAGELEALKGEAESEKAAVEKAKLDIQVQLANLKTAEANLATSEAQFKQMVAEQQAQEATAEKGVSLEERQILIGEVDQALQVINAQAEAFMQQAAELMQQVQAVTQQPVAIDRSSRRLVKMKRINGKLSGELINADTGEVIGNAEVARVNGELIGSVNEV